MIKTKNKIFFLFLVCFSIYCALSIGQSWDEVALLTQGKITLDYLLSLGRIDTDTLRREYYSPIYYSLKFLLMQIFPIKYQFESSHLINLIFSLSAIIGIKKLCKELFNDDVGKIVFLILFFYPSFFGHMAFNSKDTILAFNHVWIFYLFIKYLKKQNIKRKANNYINFIAVFAALGTGINFFFLGTLAPVFLFFLVDIFFFKKFICKDFKIKKFFIDAGRGFLIFYILLIIFWIDTHPNIFILPFNFFLEWVIGDFWRGYPYILLNGEYFIYKEIPKSYFFINLIYKSPEYFLLTYAIFFIIFLKSNIFFKKKFYSFNYKFFLITSTIVFPFLVVFFINFSLYDGLRLVLWTIPYFCIIPGLTIYYLIQNISFIKTKLVLTLLSLFIIYFLINFFLITPYQYTYLNILNGKVENRYKKFENDYWGSSIKELMNKVNFDKEEKIVFATCGINQDIAKYYLEKKDYSNFIFGNEKDSDYIIMTNRVTLDNKNIYKSKNLINCFDKFKGENAFKVTRSGLLLSVIRKIN